MIQEQRLDIHYNETADVLEYLADPSVFTYEDGFVATPGGPGLGIEVDEEHVRDQAEQDVDWHNSVWRHEDGSIAEWNREFAVAIDGIDTTPVLLLAGLDGSGRRQLSATRYNSPVAIQITSRTTTTLKW